MEWYSGLQESKMILPSVQILIQLLHQLLREDSKTQQRKPYSTSPIRHSSIEMIYLLGSN